jgi:DNA mismatch endonuclease (patch repair protein)
MEKTGRREPSVTSRIMAAVRCRDTRAEVLLRSRLWAAGARYRKHCGELIGCPDIAFPGARVVVFVDGDFWHGNAWRIRGLPSLDALFPTRTEWWVSKIRRNMERDKEVTARLTEEGWLVLRFWESDVMSRPDLILSNILMAVRDRRGMSRVIKEETRSAIPNIHSWRT